MDRRAPVEELRNIGPASASWLRDVGVDTLVDLERIGVVEAYRRARLQQPGASLNLLYALQGAVWGIGWNEVPPDVREALRTAVEEQ